MNSPAPTLKLTGHAIDRADKYLGYALNTWFVVAVIGQLLFAIYVAAFYGGAMIDGNMERWNDGVTLGHQAGKTMSNLVVGVHLFFAVLIMLGGPLQFIGGIRRRFPAVHRWNGRIYVCLTAIGGLTGLWMLWVNGSVGNDLNHLAMSLEAGLIVFCGAMVWRMAVTRRMRQHEQWAARLFLVASGVWFFRVFLMGWLMTVGQVGIDFETFTGPLVDVIYFAHYLLPLAVYEGYLLAKRRGGVAGRYTMVGVFVASIVVTAIGIVGATVGMWLPKL